MPNVIGKLVPNPLVIPAMIWILGLLVGFTLFPLHSHFVIQVLFALSALPAITFITLKNPICKNFSLIILIFIVAILHSLLSQIHPPNHIAKYLPKGGSRFQQIEVSLSTYPQRRIGNHGISYRVNGNLQNVAGHPVTGKVSLLVPASHFINQPDDLRPGSRISLSADLYPFRNNRGFSRIPEQYFRSAKAISVSAHSRSLVQVLPDTNNRGNIHFLKGLYKSFSNRIVFLKKIINSRIEQRFAPDQIGLVKALLLGDREDVYDLQDILSRGGIAHLLAISGLHLAIITLIVKTLLGLLLIRRTPANIIIIILVIVYGELCGWIPSISRAGIMITLLMIAGIMQRKPCYNNILAACIILISAIHPAQIFAIGLQLSFLATWVIINILPPLNFFFSRLIIVKAKPVANIIRQPLKLVLVTIVISILISPLTLYYFNHFSLNGIIGNIVGIPLLTLIIPLALFLISAPSLPIILTTYSKFFDFVYYLFISWSRFSSELPFYYSFIPFNQYQLLISYSLLILIYCSFFTAQKPLIKRESLVSIAKTPWYLTFLKLRWVFALSLILLLLIILPAVMGRGGVMKVTFFDVGHGDCFLIETATGKSIMIDTGAPDQTNKHISKAVLPYLQQNGIRELDWVVITHPHNDHYGGLQYLASQVDVKNLMITEYHAKDSEWGQLYSQLQDKNINLIAISDTTHIASKSASIRIIHPDKYFHSTNHNEMSIVVALSFRNFAVLFTGDLEKDGEMYLVSRHSPLLSANLLKVGHHGSNTSSSLDFLDSVRPDYAFIPAAKGGRFIFPHPETLDRLSQFIEKELIFNGAEHGSLQITTDGLTGKLKTFGSKKELVINF